MKTFTQNSKHGLLRSVMAAFFWCLTLVGYQTHSQVQLFENAALGQVPTYPFYVDADGDSYGAGELVNVPAGDPNIPPVGYSLNNIDCDDNNADIFQSNYLYGDHDSDGYFAFDPEYVCYGANVPAGYSLTNEGFDCDDNNPDLYRLDTFYLDSDGDGYSYFMTEYLCYGNTVPAGYSLTTAGEDCDDGNAFIYQIAEFFVDNDGDGYTNGTGHPCSGTEAPAGYSLTSLGTDCNDNDATKWQVSIRVIEDADGDGWGGDNYFPLGICYGESLAGYILWPHGHEYLEWDCDDSNPEIYYGVPLYTDSDGDGWDSGYDGYCTAFPIPAGYSYSTQGADCDDAEATVWQSAVLYVDSDADGYDVGTQTLCYGLIPEGYSTSSNGSDCNDENAGINPDALEITNNNIDENCNGMADDTGTIGQNTTVIIPSQCGTTLAKIYNALVAVASIPNVTMYTFEVTDENNWVQTTPGSNVNYFQLTSLADYQYSMDYSVRVGLHVNGVWQGFGPACTVRTPDLNIVIPQCGTTLAQPYSPIFVTGPSFISSGQVRVTNQSTLASQTITRTAPWFNLSMFPAVGLAYSTSYSVEVRVATTGGYGDWTLACTITTPAAPAGKAANTASPMQAIAYPNPYNDTFILNLQSTIEERVQVKVYDMIGKLLEIRDFEPNDLESHRLGNAFPAGVYSVVVTQGGAVESIRVIKR